MPWMKLISVCNGLFSTDLCITFATLDGVDSQIIDRTSVSSDLGAVQVEVLDVDETRALVWVQDIVRVSRAQIFEDVGCFIPARFMKHPGNSIDTFDSDGAAFEGILTQFPIVSREVIRENQDVRVTVLKFSEDAKRELSTNGAALKPDPSEEAQSAVSKIVADSSPVATGKRKLEKKP